MAVSGGVQGSSAAFSRIRAKRPVLDWTGFGGAGAPGGLLAIVASRLAVPGPLCSRGESRETLIQYNDVHQLQASDHVLAGLVLAGRAHLASHHAQLVRAALCPASASLPGSRCCTKTIKRQAPHGYLSSCCKVLACDERRLPLIEDHGRVKRTLPARRSKPNTPRTRTHQVGKAHAAGEHHHLCAPGLARWNEAAVMS